MMNHLTGGAVMLVLSELELGATFCEVALGTQDEKTKERNIRNARNAYETALRLLQRLNLGNADRERFEAKALHLKGLFERLGLNPNS
jgi:hypothetical protein